MGRGEAPCGLISTPIKRQAALSRPVTALAKYRPVIIDESDGELSTFPEALKLGYAGVSTKNCKGFYKSILNAEGRWISSTTASIVTCRSTWRPMAVSFADSNVS